MSVYADAKNVLHTATAATDGTLLAWSVGAFMVRHCLSIVQYRRTRDVTALDYQTTGGAGGGFQYWNDSKAFHGTIYATDHQFRVRWRDVATVLDRVVDDPDLADEQRTLLARRVELTGHKMDLFHRWQFRDRDSPTRAERDAHHEQWFDIERRCEDAAARTWGACYPHAQQLDLFA